MLPCYFVPPSQRGSNTRTKGVFSWNVEVYHSKLRCVRTFSGSGRGDSDSPRPSCLCSSLPTHSSGDPFRMLQPFELFHVVQPRIRTELGRTNGGPFLLGWGQDYSVTRSTYTRLLRLYFPCDSPALSLFLYIFLPPLFHAFSSLPLISSQELDFLFTYSVSIGPVATRGSSNKLN